MEIVDKKLKNYAEELVANIVVDAQDWWSTPNKDMNDQIPEQLWNHSWIEVIKYLHIKNNL